jgi:DNA-binding CsgD family transcriptional regulator/tetratricopeptide (TPR) repeat protein
MTAPLPPSLVSPVLVGREIQLGALDRLIEQAARSNGATALITGEAGIGKSRLVAETIRRVRSAWREDGSREPLVLQGRCFEPDRALPYAPLRDLLRTYLAADSAPASASLPPQLATLLPELQSSTPLPALDAQQERQRIIQAFVQFATQRAARPLLVVIEDLHWSDEASLDTLLMLARRITSQPILLLLTYRDDERTPELDAFLAALNRERLVMELALVRLGSNEVDAMLRAIFELPRPVRAEFLEALYVTTEGNPFFIEEVLKALAANGEIFYADGAWDRKPLHELHLPRSVQLAVQHRLRQLSPQAREVLTFAAVAGRRFDFRLLQALTSHDDRTLLRLIKELIAAQLVVEESEDMFVFRHALTRQAVEADLLARERRALHRTIAEAMERLSAAAPHVPVSDLAEHWYAAGAWEQTLTYARHAGEQARALYAPRAAATQFSRAIEATQRLGQEPPAELYRARGQVYELLDEFEAARSDYTQAQAAARATGDRRAEWQSSVDLGFLWIGRDYARAGAYLEQALQLAREIGDPSMLAHSLNRMANWYANSEQPIAVQSYHEEALTLFEAAGDQRGQAATLDLLGTSQIMIGDVISAAHYYGRAATLLRVLDDRQGLVWCLSNIQMLGAAYVFDTTACPLIDLAVCLHDADEALGLARQIDWRAGEASVLMYTGLALGPRGAYARAIEAAQQCIVIATEIEHRHWAMAGHWTLGAIYLDLLWLPEARRYLEQALELARTTGHEFSIRMASSFLAETCIAQADLARARSVLDTALEADAPMQTLAERRVWAARAGYALRGNMPERALQIVDRLIASAPSRAPGRAIPYLWHLRAQALMALERKDEAGTVLQEAQAAAVAQGLPPLRWRIASSQARLSLALRRREQAEAACAVAQALITELSKDVPDPSACDAFLSAATAQLPQLSRPSPRRAAKQAFDGLTTREREVAVLVAQGRSNREIGETMVVSERTVEKHVENILAKLAFSSRAQIAAWAVEKALRAPSQDS